MASLVLVNRRTIMSSRRALTALNSLIQSFHRQSSILSISIVVSSDLSSEVPGTLPFPSCFGGLRKFHAGYTGRLNFRETVSSQAGFATTDYSDEEKSKSARDEGNLEVSKLGIHQDIVSALARKGITKLFPIQRLGTRTINRPLVLNFFWWNN